MHPEQEPWEAFHSWTSAHLRADVRKAPDGTISPWPGSNFASRAFPRLWLRSPIQVANEIDKTVGFPILSSRYRSAYRRLAIDEDITDPELRAAITRRVVMATLQPASSFMNAIRERLSLIQRAGGRSARKGPSYINGAAYSPRVLIAVMNIWRVYCNYFDWRTYSSPLTTEGDEEAPQRKRRLSVPNTNDAIEVPVRPRKRMRRTTPAIRMGVHIPSAPVRSNGESDELGEEERSPTHDAEADAGDDTAAPVKRKNDRRRDDRPYLPNLSRVLYQPWLFYGTPMWAKLQGR